MPLMYVSGSDGHGGYSNPFKCTSNGWHIKETSRGKLETISGTQSSKFLIFSCWGIGKWRQACKESEASRTEHMWLVKLQDTNFLKGKFKNWILFFDNEYKVTTLMYIETNPNIYRVLQSCCHSYNYEREINLCK